MSRTYIYACLVCMAFFAGETNAQTDTLRTVTVTDVRMVKPACTHISADDSATLARNAGKSLAQSLADGGQVYVKQYGPGNIATVSMRGGSSYHTALTWNGLNLTNAMLGNADLSLLPAVFTDQQDISFGGASVLWGSGSVSGTINSANRISFQKQLDVMAGYENASFHNQTTYGKIKGGTEKWYGSARWYMQWAENDFSYYNPYSASKETLDHGATGQHAFFAETGFRTGTKSILHFISFINASDREIPPSLAEGTSTARQQDKNLRSLIYWKHATQRSLLFVRAAILGDKIIYSDAVKNIHDTSAVRVFPAEIEWKYNLNKNHVLMIYTGYRAVIGSYPFLKNDVVQHTMSSLSSWQYTKNKLGITVSGRIEKSMQYLPVTGSAGLNYAVAEKWTLAAAVSTLYRVPTLNDLYWIPGGNPDLKPEKGYNLQGGIKFIHAKKHFTLRSEGWIFYRNMRNWIQWKPGPAYWSPQNIDHVESYGSESSVMMTYTCGKIIFSGRLNTQYAVSSSIAGAYAGRQLIYTPMYSGAAGGEIRYRSAWVAYIHTYTGYRYISADNYDYLPPYKYAAAEAGLNIRFNACTVSLSGGIRNIFHNTYYLISNRPMPGRNYFIRIQFYFKTS